MNAPKVLASGAIMYVAASVLVLFGFWLLLSGIYTPFLVGAGLVTSIAVTLLARKMATLDREGFPAHILGNAVFSYWPWLLKEIVKSAWSVSKCIISPSLPISPTMIEFEPSQKTVLGLVIHANSITLTPGTITIRAERGRFLAHALTREGAVSLAGSDMDIFCSKLERA